MNTVLRIISAIAMAITAIAFAAGCAQQSTNTPPVGAGSTVTPFTCTTNCAASGSGGTGVGEDPTVTGFASGSTAAMSNTQAELSTMFFNTDPSSASNVRINVDTTRLQTAVIVAFTDQNGQQHEAAFGSVHPYNPNVSDTSLNQYYTQGSVQVWKGFFQDVYGAVILIIDRQDGATTGDGQPSGLAGGSLWFQNFNSNYPNDPLQGPLKMCWQISLGPYDCRSFLVNNVIEMTSSYYPNNIGPYADMYYTKLGDFDGLNTTDAGIQ